LRILSSKMVEYEMEAKDTYIDEEDLALVEKGAAGMRIWTSKEAELIEKSRKRRARLQAERKRNRQLKIAGVVVISILTVISSLFWLRSSKEAKVNQLVSEAYQLEKNDALKAMGKLDEALSILPEHQMTLQTRHDVYLRNEFYSQTFSRNDEPVFEANFAPGDSILVTCQGKSLWFWRRNGTLIDSVSVPIQPKIAEFSPDGQYLYVGGQGGLLRYDTKTRETKAFGNNNSEISALAISSDGKKVISGDISGQITIWDHNGNLLHPLKSYEGEITAIVFAPNQEYWLGAGIGGELNLYNLNGDTISTSNTGTQITAATFIPNGKFVVTGLRNGQLQKRSLEGELLGTYNGHSQRVNSMHYSPDGKYLLTSSDESAIFLWSNTWKVVRTYRGHGDYVYQVDISADGNSFLSASKDGTAKYWKVRSKVSKEIIHPEASIQSLKGDKTGNTFMVGTGNEEVEDINALGDDDFFDLLEEKSEQTAFLYQTGLKPTQTFTGHEADITAVAYDAENQLFLTGDGEGQIIIWNEKGEKAQSIQAHKGRIFSLDYFPDTKQFVSGSADKKAVLWSASGDSLMTFAHPKAVSSVLFLPKGEEFLTGCYDGFIRRWSVGGQLLQAWKASEGTVEALAISPNGKWLASGHGGETADVKNWSLKGELQWEKPFSAEDPSGGKAVYTVAFDDASEKIIAGGTGGTVEVYDLEGHLIQTVDDFDGASVYGIMFSAEKRQIICGSGDGRVQAFEVLE
ncbi:MAG: hypothetical protein KDD99_14955, partial [Bacteroidetes bacterium]|nr:hypothetical protein [Bacteroidota bacterium]